MLLLLFRLGIFQNDQNASSGINNDTADLETNDETLENDLQIFDYIYRCLSEYTEEVTSSLHFENEEMAMQVLKQTNQMLEECKAYPKFKFCLQKKSGNLYIDEFVSSLESSMGFCSCLRREILVPTKKFDENEAAYCHLCEDQIPCLEPYISNPYVKEIWSGLNSIVKSDHCANVTALYEKEKEKSTNEKEREKEEKQEEKKEEESTASPSPSSTSTPALPGEIYSVCSEREHYNMSFNCAVWLHSNYHSIKGGWKSCSSFTASYNKPCGFYWAKCKKSNKTHNKNCCISVHCYGGLGK